MFKLVLSVCSIALVFSFAACKKSSNNSDNTANVMFVHGCAAGATLVNLDARLGNVAVPGATNLQFLKSSGYQHVTPAAAQVLSFFVTGLNELTHQTVELTAKNHYTAFASGSISNPGIVFLTDDLSIPSSGKAKVRFVNLSPDALVTSCYVGTAKLDSNVAMQGSTQFFEVPTTVSAKVSMIDQTVLSSSGIINSQVLVAGKIYTFMLTGSVTGSGSSQLSLSVINNN
jgi:hypothetical protein